MGISIRQLIKPLRSLLDFPRINLKIKIGLTIFLILLAISILEPSINYLRFKGKDFSKPGSFERLLPPSLEFPLGTSSYGRDVFGSILLGLRYTLQIGILSGILITMISVTIGFLAG